MKSNNILYLASKSSSRRHLLDEANIAYEIIEQDAPETSYTVSNSLGVIVKQIALEKMDYVALPKGVDGQVIYVLTADTLCRDVDGNILFKPVDYQDAVKTVKRLRSKDIFIYTGFCLDKKVFKNNSWMTCERILDAVGASCIVDVPDDSIETYFESTNALCASGSLIIDNFGMQFVKSVNGSYSAIIGLPLFEIRESLCKLGFFSS